MNSLVPDIQKDLQLAIQIMQKRIIDAVSRDATKYRIFMIVQFILQFFIPT